MKGGFIMGLKMTIKEAAQAVGMSEHSIRQKIKMGLYPFIRCGVGRGRIFVDIDLLEKAIEQEQADNMAAQRAAYEQYQKEKNTEVSYLGKILSGR
jgi:hypothetical protein